MRVATPEPIHSPTIPIRDPCDPVRDRLLRPMCSEKRPSATAACAACEAASRARGGSCVPVRAALAECRARSAVSRPSLAEPGSCSPAQKAVDRAGIRVGGIIRNSFRVYGRIMPEGLVAGDSREDILSQRLAQVSGKLAAPCRALSRSPVDWKRALLADPMIAEAALQGWLIATETAMRKRWKPAERSGSAADDLGIYRLAAASTFAEIGPNRNVFGTTHAFAARTSRSPGNDKSTGRRRHGTARKGSPHLCAVPVEDERGAKRTHDFQFEGFCRKRCGAAGPQLRRCRQRSEDGEVPVRDASGPPALPRSRHQP